MRSIYRAAIGLFLSLGLAVHANEIRVEPRVQQAAGAVAKTQATHARAVHVRPVVLPPVLALPKAEAAPLPGTPLQIGSGREVPELESDAASGLTWDSVGNAKVSAFSITSPGAKALRAGLRVYAMPEGAVLRFYGPADMELVEVTGKEILATLAKNEAAGDRSENAHTFWSPSIEAETIVVEMELPAGTNISELNVAVPFVTHMTSSVKFASVTPYRSSACEVDATCSIATWGSSMNSVAHLQFQIGSSGYICTGTLMADQDPSSTIPYFLTANHCVGDQTTANTVETWWFYRSASCGSTTMNAAQRLTGGATLLYASNITDTSFMRLNGTPPAGAVFSGWIVSSGAAMSAAATGIHHPMGDMQKISFGNVVGYWTCVPASGGQFSCTQSNATSATFYEVSWRQGITEPGSSGSGIFLDNGKYLVGQLYGGSSSCGGSGTDVYGRLDKAYNTSLNTWLAPPATPMLTIAKLGSGSGTVTSQPAGINCGATCSASFTNNSAVVVTAAPAAGSIFAGWTGACVGNAPSCTVTVSGATTVAATFYTQQTLTVTRIGTGTGTITSSPSGINCGATCSAVYLGGIGVTLTATPAAGQYFFGWGGACSGTGLCTVSMNGPVSVTANFSATAPVIPSIAMTVAGDGVVISNDWSIYCSTTCTKIYAAGTVITLTAYPNNASTFTGWSGACSGTATTCTLTVSSALATTATFGTGAPPPPPPPTQQALTISRGGTGTGTVTSSPAGINCGATCSASFTTGASVTLTAAPASGSTFAGWSGACSGIGSCVVAMNAAATATATFNTTAPTTQMLSVTRAGTGSGSVASSPAGINCGATCSASFTTGASVTLTATPASGSTFAGWSGACSGMGSCIVAMNAAASATATFTLNPVTPPTGTPSITLTVAGNGVIIASDWSIYCSAACVKNYAAGTVVTLTAYPNNNTTFQGWGGACSGTSTVCTLTVSSALSVTAGFGTGAPPPPPPPTQQALSVAQAGTGSGSVASSPAGINCGATCSASFNTGTSVTLSATPASGSTFSGWSGACSGTGACVVALNAAASATATFTLNPVTPPPPPPPPTGAPSITLTLAGDGVVIASDWSIYCAAGQCTHNYPAGTVVTLTAYPNNGTHFTGWSGACSGTALACTLTVTGPLAVSAGFAH